MAPARFRFRSLVPPGRGAIAIVEIRGQGAGSALEALAGRKLDREAARHERFRAPAGDLIDDGLAVPLAAAGEPAYLLTLHGNPILVARLLEVLEQLGGESELSSSAALLPARSHRVAREAYELLPRVRTPEAAAFLLEQATDGLVAWLDAVESAQRPPAGRELREVLDRAPSGRALFEPRRVVLAGVPNAGKSTLFNALYGRRRVIDHPLPGTTRDIIQEEITLGAYPVRLVDGAGVRKSADPIEREGVERMTSAIAAADLVVVLRPPPHCIASWGDGALEAALRGARRILTIASRADERSPHEPPPPGAIDVSARTGAGVAALEERMTELLFGTPEPCRGVAVPFLARHEEILTDALRASERGADPRAVIRRFGC